MQERAGQNTKSLGKPAPNAPKHLVMLENSPATRYRPETRPEAPREACETGRLFIRT